MTISWPSTSSRAATRPPMAIRPVAVSTVSDATSSVSSNARSTTRPLHRHRVARLDVAPLDSRVERLALELANVLDCATDRGVAARERSGVPSAASVSAVVHNTVPKKPETRNPSAERLKMTPYRSRSSRSASCVAYTEYSPSPTARIGVVIPGARGRWSRPPGNRTHPGSAPETPA